MGTSNSTRRSSGKQSAAFGVSGSSRRQLVRQPEEVLPTYRKPELQDFECVICKDLVFKPVVNACGHAFFCFWCAHESMGAGFQNSTCPMCRSTFSHMPRVCELAHSYLTKVWPTEYAARAAEVEEEERQRNMFSPEPIGLPSTAGKRRDVDAAFRSRADQAEAQGVRGAEVQGAPTGSEIVAGDGAGFADSAAAPGGAGQLESVGVTGPQEFTAGDCECLLCNKLLFQPVVLSCGHAYCFLCLEERFPSGRVVCTYCQKAHLEDEVTVCGQLQEVIQGAFPHETHERIRQERARLGNRKGLLKRVAHQEEQQDAPKGFVHFGIECDACGVYPIVGERYQCQDCEEEIGFDLCGRCHGAREQPMLGSYLFQQKHLPSHRMHRVAPVPTFLHQVMDTHPELSVSTVINMVMSMVDERGEDGAAPQSSAPTDDVVDLAETGLFDEPQSPLPTDNAAAAGSHDAAGTDVAGPAVEAEEGSPPGEEEGPLYLTRLVQEVAALEQALGGAGAHEYTASAAQQAGEALAPARGADGQSEDGGGAGSEPGVQPSLSGPGSGWDWLGDSSQGADLGAERFAEGPIVSQSAELTPIQGSEREGGVDLGNTQPASGQELRLASVSDLGTLDESRFVERGIALGANQGQQERVALVAAEDELEHEGTPLDRSCQDKRAPANGYRVSAEESGQAGPARQLDDELRSEGGRGRGYTEDWCAAQDRQQRGSCEPGLRRSDSYHQLMMASA